MFQIETFTEAKLTTVTNRVEKHGDDEVPAVSLGLLLVAPNFMLDGINPTIREALYKAVDDQPALPEVAASTPVLRCNAIESVILPTTLEGWTLNVDDGIDDTTPMVFGGCKVDKFKVKPQQGGSVILRFRIGTSDVDAARLGKLAMHNGGSIWITLTRPKEAPVIDGSVEAFEKDHPQTAEDLFAAGAEA